MSHRKQVEDFANALRKGMPDFAVDLSEPEIGALSEYYDLLLRWNDRLHLVAPSRPEEFARRHVLESLLVNKFLTEDARVVDIGSGAGLPIIPCLLTRTDISATLIESSQKKSVFLREVLNRTGLVQRGKIIAKRFEEVPTPDANFLTCRALDDFMAKIGALIDWAPEKSTLLLFGGEALRQNLEETGLSYIEFLIPKSTRRFLFELEKK